MVTRNRIEGGKDGVCVEMRMMEEESVVIRE